MIKVFESTVGPANLLDDEVDSFGAAVADAVGVEVGQDLSLPDAEGTAEPGDFGRLVREAASDLELLSTSRVLKAGSPYLAVADISSSPFGL